MLYNYWRGASSMRLDIEKHLDLIYQVACGY